MLRSGRSWGRRAVALGASVLASSLLALTPVPTDAAAGPADRAAHRSAEPAPLHLAAEGPGLRAVDVRLDADGETVTASSFSLVALTWRGEARAVRVKTRAEGVWSGWRELASLDDGPDRDSGRRPVSGTDLMWVGRADAVRVDVAGATPDDLTLVLLDPTEVAAPVPDARARPGMHKPPLLSRTAWGADPGLRSGTPSTNRTIQQMHVHHTVNSNDYGRDDVPGILRAIYRYHTLNLGWSDIGYNFLVDRFGRTWIGRAGGAWKPVQGAHTLGFNSTSTGVAVIGSFDQAAPGRRVVTALVRLAAWKLERHDRDPRGWAKVWSHGSDRYPRGRSVRLPVIDGHRDTNDTACPGTRLYRRLPEIRRRAAERVARW